MMQQQQLQLPAQRDPVARLALAALAVVAVYFGPFDIGPIWLYALIVWQQVPNPFVPSNATVYLMISAICMFLLLPSRTRPKRAAERAVLPGIGNGLRFSILQRDGYSCRICGRYALDGVGLEVDHIVPRSKGGTDDPSNLQTLCTRCNNGKSNSLM